MPRCIRDRLPRRCARRGRRSWTAVERRNRGPGRRPRATPVVGRRCCHSWTWTTAPPPMLSRLEEPTAARYPPAHVDPPDPMVATMLTHGTDQTQGKIGIQIADRRGVVVPAGGVPTADVDAERHQGESDTFGVREGELARGVAGIDDTPHDLCGLPS